MSSSYSMQRFSQFSIVTNKSSKVIGKSQEAPHLAYIPRYGPILKKGDQGGGGGGERIKMTRRESQTLAMSLKIKLLKKNKLARMGIEPMVFGLALHSYSSPLYLLQRSISFCSYCA